MSLASAISNLFKILFLILLIIVIAMGGIYWFDRLGILDYKKVAGPMARYLPAFLQRGEIVEEDPYLLEREFLTKREQILEAKTLEVELQARELEEQELMLREREAKLGEEAKRLEEEKKVLSEKQREYDNYKDNIFRQATYFTSMPPEAAVERLSKMDDLLVIDILREIDRNAEETGAFSVVPFYLSLMDPDKASAVQRKMTKVGGIE
jgi:flagellar protein FlbB